MKDPSATILLVEANEDDWMRLQAGLSSVQVMILTSSDEERDQTRAYAFGARSCLVKPPTPKALRELLN